MGRVCCGAYVLQITSKKGKEGETRMNYSEFVEDLSLTIFDIETSVGLRWLWSVRDDFRYLWE